jgi:hypothetical protein
MKKTFLLIAALLLMGSAAFAGGPIDFSIGPKVGYQTAKLSYQKADITEGFANHLTVGLFGRVEVLGFYVQPEILWFKNSSVFDFEKHIDQETIIDGITIPSGAEVSFTLNSMTFQVPVLLGYKYEILDDIVAIRAQVGPTLNFTIPQKTYAKAIGTSETAEINNETFDTKTIGFGLQGGLGVDVIDRITLDINYNFGITKLYGADAINSSSWGQYIDANNISNVHSNMFMVTVGYKFL